MTRGRVRKPSPSRAGANWGTPRSARTGQESLTLKVPAQFGDLVFSPDGVRLAVRGEDLLVRLYDVRTGREALVFPGSDGEGTPVFSPDGSRLAVGPGFGGAAPGARR